ncbi:MAG: putative lipid II flippase FtsW [Thermoleophilia bacterium]|nr:putative lipid II flippase FtsW [Thermoleophilia bacterium]
MSTRRTTAGKERLEPAPWVNGRGATEPRPASSRGGAATRSDRGTGAKAGRAAAARTGTAGAAPAKRAARERSSPAGGTTAARRSGAARRAPLGSGAPERRLLLLATALLLLYGLVMAYSASAAQAYFDHGTTFYFLRRQLVFAGLGVLALVVFSRIDYVVWRRFAVPFAVVAAGLLVTVFVPGFGVTARGARRWIDLGFTQLQPSEIAKLAVVALLAALIVRDPAALRTGSGFGRLVLVGLVPFGLLVGLLQKDLGTTLVLCVGAAAVLVAGGARWRHLLGLAALAPVLVGALILIEPYRMDRIAAFVDPQRFAQTSGFQATQSLVSIASGRIFGVGLGNSVQKFGYLPEQTTDMITGIIGEELGLVGLLVLLGLYVLLAWAAFRIALSCRELFGKLLAVGIAGLIVGQAFINIGAALSVVPLTGVPLPLVSIGGTSLVVVLAGIGILVNVSTNRRSYIVVSAPRSRRAPRRGGDGRPSDARPRRRR